MMTRRTFLNTAATAGAAQALGLNSRAQTSRPNGAIVGPSAATGHLLREAMAGEPALVEREKIVIVGGGIAGLAAARRLKELRCSDFVLLELESRVGGNSIYAEGEVSAAPWGAHYVPLPSMECAPIIELFKELGVITGFDANGLPIYNEFYLCAELEERLFMHGRWREGLIPGVGVTERDRKEFAEFSAEMDRFRARKGRDGKWAFAIPVDESSRDAEFAALDHKSFSLFLDERGWNSKPLRWHVDYCCRDDFGARASQVSAWAGIHYFASRRGAASNAGSHSVVTWPEGNGWLARKMAEPLAQHIHGNSLVYRVADKSVDVIDSVTRQKRRYLAERIIFCAPRFVAHRVVEELKPVPCPVRSYPAWMVANLTLKNAPAANEVELAWDNVFYDSPSLGYVVATHQTPSRKRRKTVFTYYLPLCEEPRQSAQARSHSEWCSMIFADMEKAHPEIREIVEKIDIYVWGHGMVSPAPGYIWGEARRAMLAPAGRVHFAHSDMSGISIFEEAYIRGRMAADQAHAKLIST